MGIQPETQSKLASRFCAGLVFAGILHGNLALGVATADTAATSTTSATVCEALSKQAALQIGDVEAAKAVLTAAGATYPETGVPKAVKLDTLKSALPSGDATADAIRAAITTAEDIAACQTTEAYQALLDVADGPLAPVIATILQKNTPYSIPALITQNKRENTNKPRNALASAVLERADRQDPKKSIQASSSDRKLQAEVILALGKTGNRDAVPTIFSLTHEDDLVVRTAAREAWMAYVDGPPPPPAPRQYLKLPGGKQTDQKKPLWFTYRELASAELRERWPEVIGEEIPAGKWNLVEVSQRFFKKWDDDRIAKVSKQLAEWTAEAEQDPKAALDLAERAGRLLAEHPDVQAPGSLYKTYLAGAERLAKDNEWEPSAQLYLKAHGVANDEAEKARSLAAYHYALGKVLEDSKPDEAKRQFVQASKLDPTYAVAREAAAPSKPTNFLPIGGGILGVSLLLFIWGWRRRAR